VLEILRQAVGTDARRERLIPVTCSASWKEPSSWARAPAPTGWPFTEFLSKPFVSVLPTTPDVARHYGQVYARQRRSGSPVPVNDMWIAASAIDSGGHLVTFDKDFGRIEALDCTILAS
jgi:predicted nucleic acid-binding protein